MANSRSSALNDDKAVVFDSVKGTASAVEWRVCKSPSETRMVVEQQPSTIPKRR